MTRHSHRHTRASVHHVSKKSLNLRSTHFHRASHRHAAKHAASRKPHKVTQSSLSKRYRLYGA